MYGKYHLFFFDQREKNFGEKSGDFEVHLHHGVGEKGLLTLRKCSVCLVLRGPWSSSAGWGYDDKITRVERKSY